MVYSYETLGEHRFQALVQALFVAQHPRTQCLPVGQPDGGRDAFFFIAPNRQDHGVVQVKFSRDPQNKTERDVIQALIKSEKPKIARLIRRGAQEYYFVTNVRGTSHIETGSIDRVNAELTDAFSIPVTVWWRDDIDRRLEQHPDLKWSYPEILKATDILFLLLSRASYDANSALLAARSLTNYMATQYSADKEIRFKQADLRSDLITSFVDVPLGIKRSQTRGDHGPYFRDQGGDPFGTYVAELTRYADSDFDDDDRALDHSGLAGAFLLQMPLFKGVSRFVLEGAPGQGKSTVTQFLCQVNRLRLLPDKRELSSVAAQHTAAPSRMPFRVDLRDFAMWVSGRHPYADEDQLAPNEGKPSLENFLAMQVSWHSGGIDISPSQLLEFFCHSHSVVVLDGLDEVADIGLRTRLVQEICEAAERLNAHAKSMQMIVTSRPAAFATSPGFPEDDWCHLELADLRRAHIDTYKEKWVDAQGLTQDEAHLVSSTLHDKLDQPHLRDLARNPMQLAILLRLIHVQGAGLPEKRTTLYEEYMKLFFNREAEKSHVVRDYRDLLMSIHGALAWSLHTQVEDGRGSGRITKTLLHDEIMTFLQNEGHKTTIVKQLVKGTVERVGALVSRVEGTFEFEVQPLREYFAARHLYQTAPYAPVGRSPSGTRPERFVALARQPYWTNVTRFFCGFYDRGELAGLVDEIVGMTDDSNYRLINRPRSLAMMLLADQVFAQAPRQMRTLIDFVATEPGFHRLTAAGLMGGPSMALPERSGGEMLRDVCLEKLHRTTDSVLRSTLRNVIAQNSEEDWRRTTWSSRPAEVANAEQRFREVMDLGIEASFGPSEIRELTDGDTDTELRWLVEGEHFEYIAKDSRVRVLATQALFNDHLYGSREWLDPAATQYVVPTLDRLLRPVMFAQWLVSAGKGDNAGMPAQHWIRRWGVHHEQFVRRYVKNKKRPLAEFTKFVWDLLGQSLDEWKRNLEPWEALVDRGLDEAPNSERMLRLAMVASATTARSDAGEWGCSGFAPTKGIVRRLFFARQKNRSTVWWRARLEENRTEHACIALAILLCWGMPNVIARLQVDIERMIDGLSPGDWARLWFFVRLITRARDGQKGAIPEAWFLRNRECSPRLAVVLLERIEESGSPSRVVKKWFVDYSGRDWYVLTYVARAMVDDLESMDWNWIEEWSRSARKAGIQWLFPRPEALVPHVPREVARRVLTDCTENCEQFVAICENAYALRVARETAGVKDVADSEGWFAYTE